jgi:lipopolysaccharide transport system ATP-binding protein
MSNVAISVENLSKSYRIAHQANGARYKTLREDLMQMPKRILSRFQRFSSPLSSSETFWALKDISFEIKQGEVVGIIGRNGAGKSTLLKILSRITEPTSGQAKIYGRVGSLLEVGTGFHPELTGRENIFLNGAILGMSRAEIRARFDEIVSFAEVEKFLDTPVKRYSSGMYVRLAFAVAAHLEPDILIVDEVLAVGDAEFQQRCIRKMKEVSTLGRSVLLVSHNMMLIEQFCSRAMLLVQGQLEAAGNVRETLGVYLRQRRQPMNEKSASLDLIEAISDNKKSAPPELVCFPGKSCHFELDLRVQSDWPQCYLNLIIEDDAGRFLLHSRSDTDNFRPSLVAGEHVITATLTSLNLAPGTYVLWFRVYCPSGDTGMVDSHEYILRVDGPRVLQEGHIYIENRWAVSPRLSVNYPSH